MINPALSLTLGCLLIILSVSPAHSMFRFNDADAINPNPNTFRQAPPTNPNILPGSGPSSSPFNQFVQSRPDLQSINRIVLQKVESNPSSLGRHQNAPKYTLGKTTADLAPHPPATKGVSSISKSADAFADTGGVPPYRPPVVAGFTVEGAPGKVFINEDGIPQMTDKNDLTVNSLFAGREREPFSELENFKPQDIQDWKVEYSTDKVVAEKDNLRTEIIYHSNINAPKSRKGLASTTDDAPIVTNVEANPAGEKLNLDDFRLDAAVAKTYVKGKPSVIVMPDKSRIVFTGEPPAPKKFSAGYPEDRTPQSLSARELFLAEEFDPAWASSIGGKPITEGPFMTITTLDDLFAANSKFYEGVVASNPINGKLSSILIPDQRGRFDMVFTFDKDGNIQNSFEAPMPPTKRLYQVRKPGVDEKEMRVGGDLVEVKNTMPRFSLKMRAMDQRQSLLPRDDAVVNSGPMESPVANQGASRSKIMTLRPIDAPLSSRPAFTQAFSARPPPPPSPAHIDPIILANPSKDRIVSNNLFPGPQQHPRSSQFTGGPSNTPLRVPPQGLHTPRPLAPSGPLPKEGWLKKNFKKIFSRKKESRARDLPNAPLRSAYARDS